jgi:hypothetical protein
MMALVDTIVTTSLLLGLQLINTATEVFFFAVLIITTLNYRARLPCHPCFMMKALEILLYFRRCWILFGLETRCVRAFTAPG